jgi:hypothetical protein
MPSPTTPDDDDDHHHHYHPTTPIHMTNDLAHRVYAHHTRYGNKKKKASFFPFVSI